MYSTKTVEEVIIEPTSYCNARCPQCDRFDDKNNLIVPLKHLSLSLVRRRLGVSQLPNLRRVVLEGNCGDVLSHNDPIGLVQAFEHVTEVQLFTNGAVRDAGFFRELAHFENTHMVFSVDGLRDTNHLYRQDCDFDRIMTNAEAYTKAGGRATWKFIVFRHNQHQVEQARALSQSMGFRDFVVQHSDRSWHVGHRWPVYNRGEYQFDLEPGDRVRVGQLKSDHRQLPERLAEIYRTHGAVKRCPQAVKRSIFVDHNAHVIPCCMLSHDLWSETYNSRFLRKHLPSPSEISLVHHDLARIFSGDFYTRTLPSSLSDRPMPQCLLHCSGDAKDQW